MENHCSFHANLEFGVSSTNDSCWFSISMNWKPCWFLLRTMKSGFQLATFSCMSFILRSSCWSINFQGSEGAVVIAASDVLDCVAMGSSSRRVRESGGGGGGGGVG